MSEILRGLKEIEQAMGLTAKTLKRNGYPIRREPSGRVYAIRSELEEHVRSGRAGRACPAATLD